MNQIPFIPETAPFTTEQRAWLNGFLAGLFSPGWQPNAAPQLQPPGKKVDEGEPLLVLYGSQTGTAEGLAKRIAKQAQERGFAPTVLELNQHQRGNFASARKALIVSSTWGDGDPPDNATEFWSWLNSDSAPRLENLEFAVLGLGDRNYSDFCGASKKFDARLEALGAKRIFARCECEGDYEAAASQWTGAIWEKLGNRNRLVDSVTARGRRGPTGIASAPVTGPRFSQSSPFPTKLLNNVLLSKEGSAKEVRHYEIGLEGSELVYEPGDALGVIAENCPALVEEVIAALHCTGSERVKVGETELELHQALRSHFDITKPTQSLLAAAGKSLPGSDLAALLSVERAADLKKWLWGRDVLDILRLFPEPLPIADLLPMLQKLSPRLYSIASSAKAHPNEVHLTVGAVRYENFGRARKGVASTFLADRAGKGGLKVFMQPSRSFKLPTDGTVPIIMVGPGTGVAPFRAFLEEREASGAKGKNWLVFGDQKRATDFLYEEQILHWQESKLLTRLDLAFSRDQSEKLYVQHRMIEAAAELWSWLEQGAHFYVCGDASRMAKDVDAALRKIIETAGGKNSDEAESYVAQLRSTKRYQRDVY